MRGRIVTTLVVGALVCGVIDAAAQVAPEDSAAIRSTALDYVEGWYEGNAERMERCLHPELAKRIITTDPQSGHSRLEQMGALRLVQYAEKGYGTRTPDAQRIKNVEILDIYRNAASVKAEMSGWIDYMHIGRSDGRWVIVNVLWERKPKDAPKGE
jgi:hypothetical protein